MIWETFHLTMSSREAGSIWFIYLSTTFNPILQNLLHKYWIEFVFTRDIVYPFKRQRQYTHWEGIWAKYLKSMCYWFITIVCFSDFSTVILPPIPVTSCSSTNYRKRKEMNVQSTISPNRTAKIHRNVSPVLVTLHLGKVIVETLGRVIVTTMGFHPPLSCVILDKL